MLRQIGLRQIGLGLARGSAPALLTIGNEEFYGNGDWLAYLGPWGSSGLEHGVEDRIADRVADLVGVPLRHRLAGEQPMARMVHRHLSPKALVTDC